MRRQFLFFLLLMTTGTLIFAQQATVSSAQRLNVFIDCNACDNMYLKQQLNYINHAVDPYVAQVHLFIAHQRLNSGGNLYKLNFIGKGNMESIQLQLDYEAMPTATSVEVNEGLKKAIEMGLVAFLANTRLKDRISVKIDHNEEADQITTEEISGPLDNWIFEIFTSANWNRESRKSVINTNYGMDADYVTPEWRIRIRPYYSYQQQKVKNNGETIQSIRRRSYLSSSIVKSLSDHWSFGLFNNLSSSTYSNIRIANWLAPALEYNIFPYSEVPFKEFTVAYHIGWLYRHYFEETIFLKTQEDILQHSVNVNLRLRQPWGYINSSLRGSNFLNDWSKNRLVFNSRLSVRVMKGFSVNLSGGFEVINDQVSLPKGEASIEEILLGQRQLATNFNTNLNFGLSYTFGDLYNNVVNTRL